jgi:hypothetical protein
MTTGDEEWQGERAKGMTRTGTAEDDDWQWEMAR